MRVPAVVVAALLVATAVGLGAAHQPAATDADSGDIRVVYEVGPSTDAGSVRVTAEVDPPPRVAEFEFGLPAGATVVSESGFRTGGDELDYSWDGHTQPASLTYRLDPGDGGEGSRFDAGDDWAFFQKRAVTGSAAWRYRGSSPAFVEEVSLGSDATGLVGHDLVLLGEYETLERGIDGGTLRLVVPESATLRADPDAAFDSLAFARTHLDVGHRHDQVTGFVHPATLRDGGFALQGAPPEFVVNEAERPAGVRQAWIHEYVHTRQNFTTTDEMAWLFEGSATYEAALLALQHGNATWEGFERTATTDRYPHVDLRTTNDGAVPLHDYEKGAAVVAVLDAEIRHATNGERTFETVLKRLNEQDGPIDSTAFERIVSAVAGRPLGEEVDELVTTEIDPAPPDDPFLYATGPDADDDRDGLSTSEEREAGTHPFQPDTDGDGLADGGEVHGIGSDPTTVDTDEDRLEDGQEVTELGTDPTEQDTDGDGVADEVEVRDRTDPTNPDTDGDGFTDGVEYRAGTDATDPDDVPESATEPVTQTVTKTTTEHTTDEGEPTVGDSGPVALGPLLGLAVVLGLLVRLVRRC